MKMRIRRFRRREFSASILILIALLHFISGSMAVGAENSASTEVYVYEFPDSQRMKEMEDCFSRLSGVKVVFHYLNDSKHLEELLEIIKILVKHHVPILPPNICITCKLQSGSWQEIYVSYSIPLLVVFKEGSLVAILISKFDENVLRQALERPENTLTVFLSNGGTVPLDGKAKGELEELLKEEDDEASPLDFLQVLSLIVAAACVDAVNPCEFFVLTVFLSLVVMRFGREAILKFGFSYSLAIFIIYFLMGVGMWRLIGYLREARILVVVLGFSLGLRSILNFIFGFFGLSIGLRETLGGFLNRRFKRLPTILSRRLAERLRSFSNNPISAFLTGVITSVFLLPCTSGPYLIALSLLADLETKFQGVLLLLLYNGIIVVPFIIITLGMHMLKLKTRDLKRWSSTKQRWLNLIGGLLMIALSMYLIAYTL